MVLAMQIITTLVLLMLVENNALAQVFKCEGSKGNIVYQDKACTNAKKQSKVVLDRFDPEIVLKAQKKLNIDLKQRKELKAVRAQQALKEREILAIEKQARSNEKPNRYTIENNTDAVRFRKYPGSIYYNYPIYRPKQQNPNYNPKKLKNGLDMDIRMK